MRYRLEWIKNSTTPEFKQMFVDAECCPRVGEFIEVLGTEYYVQIVMHTVYDGASGPPLVGFK